MILNKTECYMICFITIFFAGHEGLQLSSKLIVILLASKFFWTNSLEQINNHSYV